MKICKGCGLEKPHSAFHKSDRTKSGLRSRCKVCFAATTQLWRKSNPEKVAEFNKRGAPAHERSRKRRMAESPRIGLISARRSGLQRRPTDNPISINELIEMWESQRGLCAVSGIPMIWSKGDNGRMPNPTSVSLDRIDNNRSYESGNVRLICHAFNSFRGRMTDEQMYDMADVLCRYRRHSKLRIIK